MDVFLDRSSFLGPSINGTSAISFLSQATFGGCIAFANLPRRDVERLLPLELELAANTSSTPEWHPVVFIFGEVTEGAGMLGGFTLPLGVNYHEFGIAIPFVTHRNGQNLHTYIPRMYSDHTAATWTGNTYFGFSKEMAAMRWQGPLFVITTQDGALLLHAAVEPGTSWLPGGSCELPNFVAMQGVFALPVVGRKSNGTYVCSYFGWDFSEALVRAADSYVSIDAPLVAGLTPRRCHDVASGSFEVRGMKWKLSWPSSCRFC